MKEIKSKPKEVKGNTHKLKTGSKFKSRKITTPIKANIHLKSVYTKTKAELQRQTEEQNERPENYAVDEVEEKAERAVYAAADTVQR